MLAKKLAILLSALELWFLHGLDMQFYTIQNVRLFDINLFLAVMTNIIIIVLLLIDEKRNINITKRNN